MKLRSSHLGGVVMALAVTCGSSLALASSHREAPAISNDPAADNTDLYAWVQGTNLVVLANYIPLEEPAGGPNFHKFSDDVVYRVNIARGGADLKADIIYEIRFKTSPITVADPNAMPPVTLPNSAGLEFFSQLSGQSQTYSVTKLENGQTTVLVNNAKVAPANIGPRTNAIAYGIPANKTYEQYFVDDAATSTIASLGAGQGRAFAGPRDDGFYVDLGGVFDLAGLRSLLGNPVDNVAGYNTHTIALELPLSVVNGSAVTAGNPSDAQTVGIWASAARRQVSILRNDGTTDSTGPWRQVSRLGLPLVNEALIGLQDKDKWNRMSPSDDLSMFAGYILNPIVVRDAEAVGYYAAGGPLQPCVPGTGIGTLETGRFDIVDVINLKNVPTANAHSLTTIGDVLRVDLGIPSGFPNGRALTPGSNKEGADVTDVELGLILCQNNPAVFGGVIPDGANSNDATFKAGFPYLATPWEGFGGGHGKPAP